MVPKKSLLRQLLTLSLLLVFGFAFSVSARADVKNGETYKCGSQGTVDFYVGETQFHDTLVSASQNGGSPSPMVSGTHGATERSTSEAPEMAVPNGPTVRVHNGKAQYKNAAGDWIDCGRPRKQTKQAQSLWVEVHAGDTAPFTGTLHYTGAPGDDVTSLPLLAGDVVPYDGFMSPGEEVTSLPMTSSGSSGSIATSTAGAVGPEDVGSLPRH
jgi:hypothetical protein